MRILHFSDLHIGVENYGRTDPNTGLSTRLTDFLEALDELVEFALANSVDLVLLAGDAYKGRDPSQTHQRELARRLRSCPPVEFRPSSWLATTTCRRRRGAPTPWRYLTRWTCPTCTLARA